MRLKIDRVGPIAKPPPRTTGRRRSLGSNQALIPQPARTGRRATSVTRTISKNSVKTCHHQSCLVSRLHDWTSRRRRLNDFSRFLRIRLLIGAVVSIC